MTLVYILLVNVSNKPVVCPSGEQSGCYSATSIPGCSQTCSQVCYTDILQNYYWGWTIDCKEYCSDSSGTVLCSYDCSTTVEYWRNPWFLLENPGYREGAIAGLWIAGVWVSLPELGMVGPLGLPQPGALSAGGGSLPAAAFVVRKVTACYISVTICFSMGIKL